MALRADRRASGVLVLGSALLLFAPAVLAQPRGAAPAPMAPPVADDPRATAAAPAPSAEAATYGDTLRAYHAALARRRLGSGDQLTAEDVRARLADVEALARAGRTDEAIARVMDVTEHPRFEAYAETDDGRAALWQLGDALASAGAYAPARAYLRRLLAQPTAWQSPATFARRAVRRLVEIGMAADDPAGAVLDLQGVPASAPEETRGDIAYVTGRAREAAGDPDGAVAAYANVGRSSRFWAQATYLHGLVLVDQRRFKDGEKLFCELADPGRNDRTSPVFGDERYFAIRDLARLALGRVAHEQSRFDDARYYYYLVPRDSNRLAEAVYEAATSRYEKKDYAGARELLGQLDAIAGAAGHHRYEDEAKILDAYVDLAECKFEDADRKLLAFLARYVPVLDGARRVADSDASMQAVLVAARTGSDAGAAEIVGAVVTADTLRTIAALVRLDPAYSAALRRRAVLEREASGLRAARGEIDDIQRGLAATEGARQTTERGLDEPTNVARRALEGVKHALDELEASSAPSDRVRPLRDQLAALDARLSSARQALPATVAASGPTGDDLPDLLRADAARASQLGSRVDVMRAALAAEETRLARDALQRVDVRLSRLLRRARLARIEAVLGRKRTLEVEIEAINDGVIPRSAIDSLDSARFLLDSEEYWPFEGDDWPDEFVGSEVPR
jgi:hypothetical protein